MSADEQARQYAKMLLAILDGAEWEGRNHKDDPNWITCSCATHDPLMFSRWNIRLKPWELTGTVNGHTLPDGASWHRQDFTEDMLPAGMRPLMDGEPTEIGDEVNSLGGIFVSMTTETGPCRIHHNKCRTTRPIPFALTPAQIADGWLPWSGGECPVEPESRPTVMFRSERTLQVQSGAKAMAWDHSDSGGDIIAYRPDPYGRFRQALADGVVIEYQPSVGSHWHQLDSADKIGFIAPPEAYRIKEPQWIPLGPENVPPGSVFRGGAWQGKWHNCHLALLETTPEGIWLSRMSAVINFNTMVDTWLINRPRHRDADGNPTLWEPCRKQAP